MPSAGSSYSEATALSAGTSLGLTRVRAPATPASASDCSVPLLGSPASMSSLSRSPSACTRCSNARASGRTAATTMPTGMRPGRKSCRERLAHYRPACLLLRADLPEMLPGQRQRRPRSPRLGGSRSSGSGRRRPNGGSATIAGDQLMERVPSPALVDSARFVVGSPAVSRSRPVSSAAINLLMG